MTDWETRYSMSNLQIEQEGNRFRISFDAKIGPELTGLIQREDVEIADRATIHAKISTHAQTLPATTVDEWHDWSRSRILELLGSTSPRLPTGGR